MRYSFASMLDRLRSRIVKLCSVLMCLFTLMEVNYPVLTPLSDLALFSLFGLALCFLHFPARRDWSDSQAGKILDLSLAAAAGLCCLYILVQSEPLFQQWWPQGRSLGDRAGLEGGLDIAVGVVGIVLVLEATRRSIGLALPILAGFFLVYAFFGPYMPDWLFPHRGYGLTRVVSQAFLQSQGVFGTALKVMFTYVFLFVLFGAFLQATGATGFIIHLARRAFRNSPGGPAKVAVMSSGLMGSLSGSAVAVTATTGTFTIPMMRSSGFSPRVAGAVAAAASSGGALVPPIMGAGAYMMLEIVDPPVRYLEIIRAALLPALLYYLSLLLIVHFTARRIGALENPAEAADEERSAARGQWEGVIFVSALVSLIAFLLLGYTPFRAVTLSTGAILVLAACNQRTRIGLGKLGGVLSNAARNSVALVAAAASVGIVLGIVTLTGVGTRFPSLVLGVAEQNLVIALVLIMISSIILGMGLPSAVCYLLLATLIGPVLGNLGVVPLAAHFFIFYFGMMSMVTPPVALAAYTAASISGSNIMQTSLTAFRFALVGFTLPYIFVLRPQLLMLQSDGSTASWASILPALAVAVLGIVSLAGAIAGYLLSPLKLVQRGLLLVAALLVLFPSGAAFVSPTDLTGLALLALVTLWSGLGRDPGVSRQAAKPQRSEKKGLADPDRQS